MRRLRTFGAGDTMYHLGIGYAHPNMITAGSAERVEKIAQYLENPVVIESKRKLVTVHGGYKGIPVTAITTGMGPASVSCTLPEAIEACDSDRMTIIRLGTSGGLQEYLRIGYFVVTTDVDAAESTSAKIMGHGYLAEASPDVVSELARTAGEQKLPFQNVYAGRTRTTDELYCDNMDLRARYLKDKSEGKKPWDLIAVSMEASAHFAIRDRYNLDQNRDIRAGELLTVSDIVVFAEGQRADMTEFLAHQADIERAHLLAGLEALVALK